MKGTEKEYYKNPLLWECDAKIIEIDEEYIILDKTIAFPEWGGQQWDIWEIILENWEKINFIDTQKWLWRKIFLWDFPIISVDTEIYHIIEKNPKIESKVKVWDTITIKINTQRRELLSISHTASHLLYIWAEKIRPWITKNIIWCSITPTSARFDFRTEQTFSTDEQNKIINIANEYVIKNYKINIYPHKEEKEALFWECNWEIIPCWWTHISSTENIWKLKIKRKNIGKWKERLSITFENCLIDLEKYYK